MLPWFIGFIAVVVIICVHGFLGDMKVGNHSMDFRETWRGIKCLYGFHTPRPNRTTAEMHCGILQCDYCCKRYFEKW